MTTLLYMIDNTLFVETRSATIEQLHIDIATFFTEHYGIGNWLIIPTSELPADFSVNTYTIKGGALVPAPAELLAIREAAALIASREAVRVAREARYESESIKSLYWSWIESGLESDRALWIAAKNAIRAELIYPQ